MHFICVLILTPAWDTILAVVSPRPVRNILAGIHEKIIELMILHEAEQNYGASGGSGL
jgi:hypothetical protein